MLALVKHEVNEAFSQKRRKLPCITSNRLYEAEARSFNEHKDGSRFGISGVLVPTSTSPSHLEM